MKKADILPINLAVVLIGAIDLITTLYWVYTQKAIEFNPIMAYLLNTHLLLFICVKIGSLLAFLSVIEYYRRTVCQSSANKIGVFTFTAYICIYAFSFITVNKQYLLSLI